MKKERGRIGVNRMIDFEYQEVVRSYQSKKDEDRWAYI